MSDFTLTRGPFRRYSGSTRGRMKHKLGGQLGSHRHSVELATQFSRRDGNTRWWRHLVSVLVTWLCVAPLVARPTAPRLSFDRVLRPRSCCGVLDVCVQALVVTPLGVHQQCRRHCHHCEYCQTFDEGGACQFGVDGLLYGPERGSR